MARENLSYSAYLAPKYWPMWLALALARLLACLPLKVQWCIGAGMGKLAYKGLKSRRRITQANIRACFPELDEFRAEQLVKDSFVSNGIGLLEALRSWFRSPESLRARVNFHGLEHLESAKAKGKGVILLGGHYSTLDIAGGFTTLHFEADVLQRDHSNPLFNAFMTRSRQKHYETVLGKRDLRGMLRCLKRNRVVWYATDQDYGRQGSVIVPFFGVPAATLTSTSKIVKTSGAAVVPFSHFRNLETGCYEVYLHPELEDFPSGDIKADASRLNGILEQEILKAPAQYLWMHRRFKTSASPELPNIYGQQSK